MCPFAYLSDFNSTLKHSHSLCSWIQFVCHDCLSILLSKQKAIEVAFGQENKKSVAHLWRWNPIMSIYRKIFIPHMDTQHNNNNERKKIHIPTNKEILSYATCFFFVSRAKGQRNEHICLYWFSLGCYGNTLISRLIFYHFAWLTSSYGRSMRGRMPWLNGRDVYRCRIFCLCHSKYSQNVVK